MTEGIPLILRYDVIQDCPEDYQMWKEMVLDYDPDMADQVRDVWTKIHSPWNELQGARFIKDDDTIIGFMHFNKHDFFFGKAAACYLADLYIKPEHRRRGSARRALMWLEGYAVNHGFGRLYWVTHKDNLEAQGLYNSVAEGEFIRYLIDFVKGM